MSFTIQQPPRILFGRGVAGGAVAAARDFGPRGLIVHGATPGRIGWLAEVLTDDSIAGLSVTREPVLEDLEAAVAMGRAHAPDWVLAVGGGAVLDMGKAVAALIPAPGVPMDHLEGVGRALPLTRAPLPFVAVPTTAGTGAEVTKNAVIGVVEAGRKVSIRDDRMIARAAFVDPALTDGCPRGVTLASGLDAVTQVIEPYVSCKATVWTDGIAGPQIAPGLAALRRLMEAEDAGARDALAYTSLCGGLALANAGLGAVHGLAGVIGGLTGAAHGAICGVLLGPVLAMNRALTTGAARARMDWVCAQVAGVLGCAAADAPARLASWAAEAGLPDLCALGLSPADHAAVAETAMTASSTKGNPVPPTVAALCEVLSRAAAPADWG